MLFVSFIIVWWARKHSESLFPCEVASSVQNAQQSETDRGVRQHGRQTGDPVPPPRTNRRTSRQVLTQNVDGEGNESAQI